jgi:uncharacterized protein DUF6519
VRGDFTRFTFAPNKHYTGVRTQQGRVSVEADTNELQDIYDHMRTVTTGDVVGGTGGADGSAGFQVTAAGTTLTIGAGRYYVDGILCEAEGAVPIDNQPDLPAGGKYVRLPNGTTSKEPGKGTYIVYLDVWKRLLTTLDDDQIRERALGGPDTATRVKTVWQARLLRVGDEGAAVVCGLQVAAWDALIAPPTGTLAARAQVDDTAPKPCAVPAGAGYRRLENQLYRVQVHKGGKTGDATFVWSRDNGSVERRWETTTSSTGSSISKVTLSSPSGDPSAELPSGGWVELTDDRHELDGEPGTLVRVARPSGEVLEVTNTTATGGLDPVAFPGSRRARRWDSDGPQDIRVPVANGGWIGLEDGIEVHFASAATYRTGDYWTIPARTATTDVEWPDAVGGAPAALAPHGVRHSYAKLAIVSFDGTTWTVKEDCRDVFPALTKLASLFYVSGDGQEALPDPTGARVPLDARLRVGVSRGSLRVVGAAVRFTVLSGNGLVDGVPFTNIGTGPDGTISVAWSLDSTTPSQQVKAELLDRTGNPIHLPVIFTANLSRASAVSYDPTGSCVELAGSHTVQEAIDTLCAIRSGGCCITVSPVADWWAAIENLPAGEPASICFTKGRFEIERPLLITKLGHVQIHGAGPGTQIVAKNTQTAVVVADCASLAIRDVAISSGPTTVAGSGRTGSLTVQNTPIVNVERVNITCPTGPYRSGSCLAVFPALDPSRTATGTVDSVRVRDCRMTVGHLQIGILVVSARLSDISDNEITVAQDGKGLRIEDVLGDKVRRGMLLRQLAGRAVVPQEVANPPSGEVNTFVDSGRWQLRFASPVSTAEWQQFASANPPTATEQASSAGMARYGARITDMVVDDPTLLAGFDRQLGGLRRRLGDRFGDIAGGDEGRALLRDLLVPGDIQVLTAFEEPDRSRRVTIAGTDVHFDSVVGNDTWRRVIDAAGPAPSGGPLKTLKQAARKLLTDEQFRNRFGTVTDWWAALPARSFPALAQGIVLGGTVAERVRIHGNVIDQSAEGIRAALSVATSGPGGPRLALGVATIDENDIRMEVPVEQVAAQIGIFVGNASSVLVAGNNISAPQGRRIQEGVSLYGDYASRVLVRLNQVINAIVGYSVEPLTTASPSLRLVSENVAIGSQTTVSLGPQVVARDNVP